MQSSVLPVNQAFYYLYYYQITLIFTHLNLDYAFADIQPKF